MEVRRISNFDELLGLTDTWNALSRGAPFLSAEWLLTWWRHYGGPFQGSSTAPELYALAVFDDKARLIGIAPWYVQILPGRGRVVRFLGTGEVCSDYLTLLCQQEHEAIVTEALVQWLLTRRGNDALNAWDQLELSAIDADDSAISMLVGKLAEHGALLHRRSGLSTWRLELPSSWEEYLKRLSKSHRKQLRRLDRDFFATGRAVLHTVRNRAELAKAWELLVDLHQRRRATLGQPGCFASPVYAAFQYEAAAELLEAGQLRLHWLALDGRPAAAEYHLSGGNIIYAYQAGVEPKLLEQQPGRLITLAILHDAIARGYQAFDLLRGAEPYKAHWRAERRASWTYHILPGHFTDHVRIGMWRATDHVKSWLKQRLGRAALAAEAHETETEHEELVTR